MVPQLANDLILIRPNLPAVFLKNLIKKLGKVVHEVNIRDMQLEKVIRCRGISTVCEAFFLFASQLSPDLPFSAQTPFLASGPTTGSLNGLHKKN